MALNRLRAVLAIVLVLCGCDRDQGPAPVISGIDPEHLTVSERKIIDIHGQNFWLRIRGRFDDPGSSSLRGVYQVVLQRRASSDPPRTLPAARSRPSRPR